MQINKAIQNFEKLHNTEHRNELYSDPHIWASISYRSTFFTLVHNPCAIVLFFLVWAILMEVVDNYDTV